MSASPKVVAPSIVLILTIPSLWLKKVMAAEDALVPPDGGTSPPEPKMMVDDSP